MKVTGQSWMTSILLGALQTEKKVFCLKRVYDKTECPAYGLYMAHMDNSSLEKLWVGISLAVAAFS